MELFDVCLDSLFPAEALVTKSKGSLKERLSRNRQIKLSVKGRKSGKTISMPVWFVLEDEKLYLLPVRGSELNGTGTCFRASPSELMHKERKRNSRRSRSPNPRW